MSEPKTLTPAQLHTPCDPAPLGFSLSTELDTNVIAVGQERALEAIRFGIAIRKSGFNLFVLGPSGSGRSELARSVIEQEAAHEPVPSDVCYVHNFEDARRPRALRLPPGQGVRLRSHLERVVDDLTAALGSAFNDQGYRDRREAIERAVQGRHEQTMNAIAERAAAEGVAMVRSESGLTLTPMRDRKLLGPQELSKLSGEERKHFERAAEAVHEQLHEAFRTVPQLQHEERERVKSLDHEVTRAVVQALLSEARRAFGGMPPVLEHLDALERDIIDKTGQLLRSQPEGTEGGFPLAMISGRDISLLRRYRVNLLVDHASSGGAPVVIADHPSNANLVGRVEHAAQLGMLVTDFNLIEAGALHRANGGYLVLDALRLLQQPVAYEQLKRTLRSGEIRIESVAEALDLAMTVSIEPEPIAFVGKVVLVGEPWLYHRLCAADPEFERLFKVAADLERDVERSEQACRDYAQLFARVARHESLHALSADAVARLIEHASRMAEDSTRLSTQVAAIFDVMREADHWAAEAAHETIVATDVEQAIARSERRHGRMHEQVQASIADGTLHVETSGHAVGQINGLSVVELGRSRFGFPSRITACVRMGKGEVVDIEREVQMGGPIHSKGVLILSAFIGSRYQVERPLSLRATLVFEQSYGPVEGDSASLAELLALLSAISGLPLAQGIAVTGSVDQHGNVQAVGGVNQKIEGFFEICNARGLDGTHGVIIPESNRKHLMLRCDVVSAAERGLFHVYTASDIDAAVQIAFGEPAGARADDQAYPAGSVNHAIDAGLLALGRAAVEAARAAQPPRDVLASDGASATNSHPARV